MDRSRILRSWVVDFLRSTPLLWHIISARNIAATPHRSSDERRHGSRFSWGGCNLRGRQRRRRCLLFRRKVRRDDVCQGRLLLSLSPYALHCWRMAPTIEKISAITFRVLNMKASVQFYRNVLGMELLYGGEQVGFSPLRTNNSESAILNLEQGDTVSRWGRLIFHVTDVDAFWMHLKDKGFDPEIPQDASWGERYFHMLDPDGHELSFAQPLQ
jgi:catechol 2,3-dioxygenase-like lactoylglutathione lyase family enzyme